MFGFILWINSLLFYKIIIIIIIIICKKRNWVHGDISSTGFSRKLNFSSFSPKGHSFKRCVVRVIKEIIEILNPKPIKSLCHTKLEVILQITSVPHTKKNCFCFLFAEIYSPKTEKGTIVTFTQGSRLSKSPNTFQHIQLFRLFNKRDQCLWHAFASNIKYGVRS